MTDHDMAETYAMAARYLRRMGVKRVETGAEYLRVIDKGGVRSLYVYRAENGAMGAVYSPTMPGEAPYHPPMAYYASAPPEAAYDPAPGEGPGAFGPEEYAEWVYPLAVGHGMARYNVKQALYMDYGYGEEHLGEDVEELEMPWLGERKYIANYGARVVPGVK